MAYLPALTGHRRMPLRDTGRLRLGALNDGRLVFALRRRPSSVRAAAGGFHAGTNGAVLVGAAATRSPVSRSLATLRCLGSQPEKIYRLRELAFR